MMTGIFDPVFSDYSPATGISIRSRMTHTYVLLNQVLRIVING